MTVEVERIGSHMKSTPEKKNKITIWHRSTKPVTETKFVNGLVVSHIFQSTIIKYRGPTFTINSQY